MTFETLAPVHAVHDIHRGLNVVQSGWHGTVMRSWPSWIRRTYSVKFNPQSVAGGTVTISGLTELDVQPD